jgi:hypothetical protein
MSEVATSARPVVRESVTRQPERVVFSGLDSGTELNKLCQLTHEFPQIEFGVNYDLDCRGRPGFPVLAAVERVVDVLPNVVLHLRGVRTLAAFLDSVNGPHMRNLCRRFRRVQVTTPLEGYDPHALVWRVVTVLNLMMLRYSLEMPGDYATGEDAILRWRLNSPAGMPMHVLFHQEADGQWPTHGCLMDCTPHRGYLCTGATPEHIVTVNQHLSSIGEGSVHKNHWIEIRDGVRKDNKFSAGRALEFMKKLYPEN